MRCLLLAALAALSFAACAKNTPMHQVCDSIHHVDPSMPRQLRKLEAFVWISQNVKDSDTLRFVASLGVLSKDEGEKALRDRARESGVRHCALADAWAADDDAPR